VISVPLAAVQPGPNGKFAYVVDPNGTVKAVPIKVAGALAGVAAIQQGLAEGDRVVIDNQDQLAPGAAVRVVSTAEAATTPRAS
jgi:multidrug efflux system membrane fusion protein